MTAKEFVIGRTKVQLLKELVERIRLLFSVNVVFQLISSDENQWIRLNGGTEDEQEKAKEYIMSVCEGPISRDIPLPTDIYNKLVREDEHLKLERHSCAVIEFCSKELQVTIRGSEIAVALASSNIEDEIYQQQSNENSSPFTKETTGATHVIDGKEFKTLNPDTGVVENASLEKTNISNETGVKLDPSLKEFAMKLDYTEAEIDRVVRKFGPKVTQDKLLHELIRSSSGKKTGRTSEPDTTQSQAGRHLPLIVARGAPSVLRVKSDFIHVEPQNLPNPGDDLYDPTPLGREVDDDSDPLRHIVIDGSNVAMQHGGQEYFSCHGILLCVEYFKQRGHKAITVFVPSWRKETPGPENPIADQGILFSLEREKLLTWTPSRRVTNGRRIVCYDDRFILELAHKKCGIVVSNDNYRDLLKENPKWKDVIEQRLLMYSFVGDTFMVPDDPLGRHGPSLDDFLRKGTLTHPKICPFLKNCTFGLKCRYYHPERDPNRNTRQTTSRGAPKKENEPEVKAHEIGSENLRCRSSTEYLQTSRTILVADGSKPTYQSQITRGRHNDIVSRGPPSRVIPHSNQLSPDEYLELYPEGPHQQYQQTLPGYIDNFVPVNSNNAPHYYGGYEQALPGQNGVYYPGSYPNIPSYYPPPPQQWSGFYMCAPPVYPNLYRPCGCEDTDSTCEPTVFNQLKDIFPAKEHEQVIRDVIKNNPEKCRKKDIQYLTEILLSRTS